MSNTSVGRTAMRLQRLYSQAQGLAEASKNTAAAGLQSSARRTFCGHPVRHSFWLRPYAERGHHEKDAARSIFRDLDAEFQKIRENLDHSWRGEFLGPAARGRGGHRGFAAADIQETEKGLTVKLDLPGLKKQDIKVQVTKDRILTISGKREASNTTELSSNVQRLERSSGAFKREFQLPETADVGTVAARAENGVLTIEVGKMESAASGISEITIA